MPERWRLEAGWGRQPLCGWRREGRCRAFLGSRVQTRAAHPKRTRLQLHAVATARRMVGEAQVCLELAILERLGRGTGLQLHRVRVVPTSGQADLAAGLCEHASPHCRPGAECTRRPMGGQSGTRVVLARPGRGAGARPPCGSHLSCREMPSVQGGERQGHQEDGKRRGLASGQPR